MAQEPGTPGAATPAERTPATPAPVELSDLAALKALAQPRRQRMLQHLTLHGPATSATLARALGLNTGSTSYHLRELARYGFVEEAETATAGAGTEVGERHAAGTLALVATALPGRVALRVRAVTVATARE